MSGDCEVCKGYDYATCADCGSHFLPPSDTQCFDCRSKSMEARGQA